MMIRVCGAVELRSRSYENVHLALLLDSLAPGSGDVLRDRAVSVLSSKRPGTTDAVRLAIREVTALYEAVERGDEEQANLPSLLAALVSTDDTGDRAAARLPYDLYYSQPNGGCTRRRPSDNGSFETSVCGRRG